MNEEIEPLIAPSKRYCLLLFTTLEREGFEYLKSKNTFVRKFEFGQQRLRLQFVATMGLIHSVGFHLTISFDQMEKEFKKPFDSSNKTFGFHLSYLNNFLFNDKTGEYSDSTIENATESYFAQIHPKMLRICEQFSSYHKVFQCIIESPKEIINGSSVASGMRIGLFLAQYLNPNQSTAIKTYFEEYCTNILHPTVQDSTRKDFKKTYDFIQEYSLNKTMLELLGL
jgi:hypothetical protein